MRIKKALKQLYYSLALNELHLMNDTCTPNISYNSLLYLDLIELKPGCTVSQLAEMLGISKSAVTLKVNELMSQGLVKKTQSSEDRRVNYLSVTEQVALEYRSYDRRLTQAIQKIEANHTRQEIDLFVRMLGEIGKEYLERNE